VSAPAKSPLFTTVSRFGIVFDLLDLQSSK
jgi:hypothetical protein